MVSNKTPTHHKRSGSVLFIYFHFKKIKTFNFFAMQTKKIVNAIQRLTRLEKPLKLRNYRQSIKKVPLDKTNCQH